MGQTLKSTGIFLAGAIIGSFATWQMVKSYYERIADEEIADIKAYWRNKYPKEKTEENKEKERINEAGGNVVKVKRRDEEDRVNYNGYNRRGDEPEEKFYEKPYVISPDEFQEENDYEKVTLRYFCDNILVDDMSGEMIPDPEDLVGDGTLSSYGTYEDDVVYARNEEMECDYEIVADERSYEDYLDANPSYRGRK